jgi:predicted Zn-dependent protease
MKPGELRLFAACSYFTGDNRLTVRAATTLEALQPLSLEALYWSIQANERLALASLAWYRQLEPDSPKSHVLLGDIYHQLERNDDAQAEYLKALSIVPGDSAALLGLATAYFSNNNVKGAMETADAALRRTPDDPELNLIMAEVKLAQYQYEAAEPYLDKSLRCKPQMLPRVHALMGKAYAETGRPADAIEQLKMSVSSDEDGSIHYLLAHLYRKVGDAKSALEALEQMKTIKDQRRERGFKAIQDPDLTALESPPGATP